MSAPNPSTGSSPGTTMPTVPDYNTGNPGVATTAPSTTNKDDIWGLGNFYNDPVYMGAAAPPKTVVMGSGPLKGKPMGGGPGGDVDGPPAGTAAWGTTQATLQAFAQMARTDPGAFEAIQSQLYEAGFYGQTSRADIHAGQWTDQTVNALVNALGSYEQFTGLVSATKDANGNPTVDPSKAVTFNEFLAQNSKQGNGQGFNGPGGGSGTGGGTTAAPPAPPQVNLTDPAAIRAAAQQAAQAALGQGMSDEQLNAFVSQFQSQQTSAQTSTAASTTQPDLTSDALQYAEQADPGQYQTHQATGYMNAMLNLFLPSGSNRAEITPVAKA